MYDTFNSIAAAKKAYRRCRKPKDFILADDSPDLLKVVCPVCSRSLANDPEPHAAYRGNRCVYYPKLKKVIGMHYVCSWRIIFEQISKLADYLN